MIILWLLVWCLSCLLMLSGISAGFLLLGRYLRKKRAKAHRRWLRRNKVLLSPHHSTLRNRTEAVP
jgi:hypothetical protein